MSTDDDEATNNDRAFSIFGVTLAILFGTFMIFNLIIYFNIGKGLRETVNAKEKSMEAKGLKNLHEYQQFLFNLSTRFYVGVAYFYPAGFCGMEPGAYEDFIRIVANKHTFFSIIFCDENNLFKPFERNVNYFFVASLGFVLFSIGLIVGNADNYKDTDDGDDAATAGTANAVNIIWNVFVTNVVMTLLSELSYYLLSCPCCHKYGNRTELRTVINWVEYFTSYIFIAAGIVFLLIGGVCADIGLNHDKFSDQANFIFRQYIITLIIQWFQELLTFYFMFIDTNSGTCVGNFFKGLKKATCGFMAIGDWVLYYFFFHSQNTILSSICFYSMVVCLFYLTLLFHF